MAKPSKKEEELQVRLTELTADLQRQRADFENYRKRVDTEKAQLSDMAKAATIMKLLPVIDTIERAIAHAPAELADDPWAKGVTSLTKNLEKSLQDLGLSRIQATPGTSFDPSLHEAVIMDETEGDKQVVAEELRAGYTLSGHVVRPSMVKVTHAKEQ
ncbi:MAG TPA: nucleotide exchange factor GrpE [Candidatus Saccharimonadales bacterium]|nr:nucleotide exchange factor GrpE [Candidatus Saccharimonadales bacterium]